MRARPRGRLTEVRRRGRALPTPQLRSGVTDRRSHLRHQGRAVGRSGAGKWGPTRRHHRPRSSRFQDSHRRLTCSWLRIPCGGNRNRYRRVGLTDTPVTLEVVGVEVVSIDAESDDRQLRAVLERGGQSRRSRDERLIISHGSERIWRVGRGSGRRWIGICRACGRSGRGGFQPGREPGPRRWCRP